MMDLSKLKPWEIPTAKVGAGAIVLQGSQVLLVKLNYGPAKGQWALPGGRVEAGEQLQQAVEREIFEETGVRAQALDVVAFRQRLMANGLADFYFLFRAKALSVPEALVWPQAEIQEVRWWEIDAALKASEVRPMARAAIEAGTGPRVAAFSLSPNPDVTTETDFVFTAMRSKIGFQTDF